MQKALNQKIAIILAILMTLILIPSTSFATTDGDKKIVIYTTDKYEAVEFDEDDFNAVCQKANREKLDYVKFTLPSSSQGVMYYDYDDKNDYDSVVSSSKKYYYDDDDSPYLSKVVFVPDKGYSSTVTISYTGYDVRGDSFTGKVKVSVLDNEENDNGKAADTITYSTDSGEVVDFDEDDFDDVCDDLKYDELDYVKFDIPSASSGILYYDYTDKKNYSSTVSSGRKYYYDHSPNLSEVSFMPDDDYSGTVSINYKGYDTDGNSFSGKVKISVDKDKDNDDPKILTYSIDSDEELDFDDDDFDDVCDELDYKDLNYVKFDLPSSSSGTLYYDYTNKKDYSSKVSSEKKYYADESPYLSKVTFVPDSDYSGTVNIKYTGYDVKDHTYSGKIKISVSEDGSDSKDSKDDIVYSVSPGHEAEFDEDDFYDACDRKNDRKLDYVMFKLPDAASGVLYYKYVDYTDLGGKVSASEKYYYEDSSPVLSEVSFVPNSNVSGTFTIKYTGYDTKGNSFTGNVKVTVAGGNLTPASAITYSTSKNVPLYFKDGDFNTVCRSIKKNQLDYVTFTQPSSSNGTLYCGYTGPGKYTSKVSSSTKYYYGDTPYILNIAFVPADNYTGMVPISYTGYDTSGLAYSGKINISVGAGAIPAVYPNTQSSKYFNDVNQDYSWAAAYIDYLYEAGIVSGTSAGSNLKLYYPSQNATRGDFIHYLCKSLNLKSSSTTSNFKDVPVGSYYYDTIAIAKSLDIAKGTDNYFYPSSTITREDAMVLLKRALSVSGKTIASGNSDNLSVYSDKSKISDYAKDSVSSLIKAGVIKGNDDNRINPKGNLTRAEVAVIIYRTK